jgi:hypothetical protein
MNKSDIQRIMIFLIIASFNFGLFACKSNQASTPTPDQSEVATATQTSVAGNPSQPEFTATNTATPTQPSPTETATIPPTRTPPPTRTSIPSETATPNLDTSIAPGYHMVKVWNLYPYEIHMYVDGVYIMSIPSQKYLTYNAIKEGWHEFTFTKVKNAAMRDRVTEKTINITGYTEIKISP